jgi:hypothetical protein
MVAFISSTPHQTWNAIVMAKKMYQGIDCDLFLLDHCDDFMDIVDGLKKEDVFKDVYPCSVKNILCYDIKNSLFRKLKRLTYFIGWRKYLRKHAPILKAYDAVYIACNDDVRCFMLSRMKSLNPNLKAYYYEDGMADYISSAHPVNKGGKKIVSKLVGMNYNVADGITTSYVLEPDCVATNEFELKRIPKIDVIKDRELFEIMNRVFAYKPVDLDAKMLYLYNPITPDRALNELRDVILGIASKYGEHSIIYKDHPRLPAGGYDGIDKIPKEKETLWEVMAMNANLSDKIMISHCSTAMYLPKFLFDHEPVLIFLHKLIPSDVLLKPTDRTASFNAFIERLKRIYSDPDRVFAPENEGELFDYLERYMIRNER